MNHVDNESLRNRNNPYNEFNDKKLNSNNLADIKVAQF